jgi:hypothetical protein
MAVKGLRGEEEWARQMVQAGLGVVVEQHDDNSGSSMYDLGIRYPDASPGAVEVVAAAEPEQIELWNVLHRDGRTIFPSLAGGWLVTVRVPTRAKALLNALPSLLGGLEAAGIREFDPHASGMSAEATAVAGENSIVSARQSGSDFPGSVYFTFEADAAFLSDAELIATWVGEFLAGPKTEDVRRKLAASGADERHAFVLLPPFTHAPEEAVGILVQAGPALPQVAPALPVEITHVWIASTWSVGHGLRWSPDGGWALFSKLQL